MLPDRQLRPDGDWNVRDLHSTRSNDSEKPRTGFSQLVSDIRKIYYDHSWIGMGDRNRVTGDPSFASTNSRPPPPVCFGYLDLDDARVDIGIFQGMSGGWCHRAASCLKGFLAGHAGVPD
jgi:hypothetical protein